jgi:translation elongation factor EF-1beta
MSQSTLAIPNQSGANYRVAVNNALQALASLYSGTTPSESYAYQLWFDTSTNILKQRNAANNAWANLWGVTLGNPSVIDFGNTRLEIHGSGNVISNTAVGSTALNFNTTGTNNTAFGVNALNFNTIGIQNTAVGVNALASNTTGVSNTAVGVNALFSNTTGSYNTAVGTLALNSNTTGTDNTAFGVNALNFNTIGIQNTAVGANALASNTTGYYNAAFGGGALFNNTTGSNNTAVGTSSLFFTTTGINNTAVGFTALLSNTTGINNTAVGYEAGQVGFQVTTQSNNVILGNSSVTNLRCQVNTITAFSDQRDKTNIADLPFVATEFLTLLRPRKFEWNLRPQLGVRVGNPEVGFIAQEVEEALEVAGVEIPNLLDTSTNYYKDPESGETTELEVKSLGQGTLLPVIVKAIQELNERLNALEG